MVGLLLLKVHLTQHFLLHVVFRLLKVCEISTIRVSFHLFFRVLLLLLLVMLLGQLVEDFDVFRGVEVHLTDVGVLLDEAALKQYNLVVHLEANESEEFFRE